MKIFPWKENYSVKIYRETEWAIKIKQLGVLIEVSLPLSLEVTVNSGWEAEVGSYGVGGECCWRPRPGNVGVSVRSVDSTKAMGARPGCHQLPFSWRTLN